MIRPRHLGSAAAEHRPVGLHPQLCRAESPQSQILRPLNSAHWYPYLIRQLRRLRFNSVPGLHKKGRRCSSYSRHRAREAKSQVTRRSGPLPCSATHELRKPIPGRHDPLHSCVIVKVIPHSPMLPSRSAVAGCHTRSRPAQNLSLSSSIKSDRLPSPLTQN